MPKVNKLGFLGATAAAFAIVAAGFVATNNNVRAAENDAPKNQTTAVEKAPSTQPSADTAKAVFLSTAAPVNASIVPGPANKNIAPATQPSNTSQAEKAIGEGGDFSKRGIAIMVVIGKGDKFAPYKSDVDGFVARLNQEGIPTKRFGFYTNQPKTYIYAVIDNVVYTGEENNKASFGNGYDVSELNTRMYKEVTSGFRGAFPNGLPVIKAAATPTTQPIASIQP